MEEMIKYLRRIREMGSDKKAKRFYNIPKRVYPAS